MSIKERITTNPELIDANIVVGEALEKLIERKWGTVIMTFSAQNGRIATMKINDEKIYKFNTDKD